MYLQIFCGGWSSLLCCSFVWVLCFCSMFLSWRGACAGFWFCSFFQVVQASVRFINLPLVVGVELAMFSRSVKGRAVVVDPIPGWVEVFSPAT